MQVKSKTSGNGILLLKKVLQQECRLSEDEWKIVEGYFKSEDFLKNEYFLKQGKVCRKLAFIAEGVMRYCMFHKEHGLLYPTHRQTISL